MNGRAARVVTVGFAVVVWSITHALTHEAMSRAHQETGGAVPGASVGRLALGAAALVLVSGIAAAMAGRPADLRRRRRPRAGGSLAGPAAFVGAEAVTHIGAGHAAPPIALLVAALVVHAVVGTVCHQLWSTGRAERVLALLTFRPGERPAGAGDPTDADRSWATGVSRWWVSSRGPPRDTTVPSPTTTLAPLPA
ncbi:hypothetical protein [Pseudonocardia dioxanivorans]|uniref:hypothetical protein n=1 Tax=Pseudonocardia dioxanivorans TaxID=240495 RepID=UPI000CD1FB29|nr:hypothetical protein [Pseudonocardia dioxanivorans]